MTWLDELISGVLPKGANLGDGNATIRIRDGRFRVMPEGTLSGDVVHTVATDDAYDGATIVMKRLDTAPHNITVVNGGPAGGTIAVIPPGEWAWVMRFEKKADENKNDWEWLGGGPLPSTAGLAAPGTTTDNGLALWGDTLGQSLISSVIEVDPALTGPVAANGSIRLPSAASVRALKSDETTVVTAWEMSGDTLVVGGTSAAANAQVRGLTSVTAYIGSNQRFSVTDTVVSCRPAALRVGEDAGSVATAGDIRLRNNGGGIRFLGAGAYTVTGLNCGPDDVLTIGGTNTVGVKMLVGGSLSAFATGTKLEAVNVLEVNTGAGTVATAGDIRVRNGFRLVGVDNVGSNVEIIELNSGDQLLIGEDAKCEGVYLGVAGVNTTVRNALSIEGNDVDTVATTGDLRLRNTFTAYAKDFAGNNARMLTFDASDDLFLGDPTHVNDVTIDAATNIFLDIAGSNAAYVDNDELRLYVTNLRWTASASAPAITQVADGTGLAGDTMLLAAQDLITATGTKVAGKLLVRAGDCAGGTSNTGGPLEMRSGTGDSGQHGEVTLSKGTAYDIINTVDDLIIVGQNTVADVDIRTTVSFSALVGGTNRFKATTTGVAFNNASVSAPPTYTPTNVTTDRSFDANSTTLDEVADVLGTVIADLQSMGLFQ